MHAQNAPDPPIPLPLGTHACENDTHQGGSWARGPGGRGGGESEGRGKVASDSEGGRGGRGVPEAGASGGREAGGASQGKDDAEHLKCYRTARRGA